MAVKFIANEIFYDKSKQTHIKIIKKVGEEWEAEKMQKIMKDQNKL